jgi:hypothetical protein
VSCLRRLRVGADSGLPVSENRENFVLVDSTLSERLQEMKIKNIQVKIGPIEFTANLAEKTRACFNLSASVDGTSSGLYFDRPLTGPELKEIGEFFLLLAEGE